VRSRLFCRRPCSADVCLESLSRHWLLGAEKSISFCEQRTTGWLIDWRYNTGSWCVTGRMTWQAFCFQLLQSLWVLHLSISRYCWTLRSAKSSVSICSGLDNIYSKSKRVSTSGVHSRAQIKQVHKSKWWTDSKDGITEQITSAAVVFRCFSFFYVASCCCRLVHLLYVVYAANVSTQRQFWVSRRMQTRRKGGLPIISCSHRYALLFLCVKSGDRSLILGRWLGLGVTDWSFGNFVKSYY